jgi:hypothetical protein
MNASPAPSTLYTSTGKPLADTAPSRRSGMQELGERAHVLEPAAYLLPIQIHARAADRDQIQELGGLGHGEPCEARVAPPVWKIYFTGL